jgi:hypothetical protein
LDQVLAQGREVDLVALEDVGAVLERELELDRALVPEAPPAAVTARVST